MQSAYEIFWTPRAKEELVQTRKYLEENFTTRELDNLEDSIENTLKLIAKNPNLFQQSHKKGIHRAVVAKFNTMYYRVKRNHIEILSFFSNRQSPERRKV